MHWFSYRTSSRPRVPPILCSIKSPVRRDRSRVLMDRRRVLRSENLPNNSSGRILKIDRCTKNSLARLSPLVRDPAPRPLQTHEARAPHHGTSPGPADGHDAGGHSQGRIDQRDLLSGGWELPAPSSPCPLLSGWVGGGGFLQARGCSTVPILPSPRHRTAVCTCVVWCVPWHAAHGNLAWLATTLLGGSWGPGGAGAAAAMFSGVGAGVWGSYYTHPGRCVCVSHVTRHTTVDNPVSGWSTTSSDLRFNAAGTYRAGGWLHGRVLSVSVGRAGGRWSARWMRPFKTSPITTRHGKGRRGVAGGRPSRSRQSNVSCLLHVRLSAARMSANGVSGLVAAVPTVRPHRQQRPLPLTADCPA